VPDRRNKLARSQFIKAKREQKVLAECPGLTAVQGDRGHKLVGAFVADPSVTNSSFEIEFGFFGHQEHAPAAWTVRPAEFRGRGRVGVAGELDAHRRISSTASSPHP
jgi:hypothetical protein